MANEVAVTLLACVSSQTHLSDNNQIICNQCMRQMSTLEVHFPLSKSSLETIFLYSSLFHFLKMQFEASGIQPFLTDRHNSMQCVKMLSGQKSSFHHSKNWVVHQRYSGQTSTSLSTRFKVRTLLDLFQNGFSTQPCKFLKEATQLILNIQL